MKKLWTIVILISLTSMTGKRELTGIGSMYANKFEGRKTANGEIFTQKKLTGASNNFPLGTIVSVTNMENGCSVVIKVNDRMAISSEMKGRIIDLSTYSAHSIGFYEGLIKIKVKQI